MPELLPIPLSLPRPTTNGANNGSRTSSSSEFDNSDTYGSLNDFRKMMSDLNV